jgi:hypothetical protein
MHGAGDGAAAGWCAHEEDDAMSERLYVATRKGLFVLAHVPGGSPAWQFVAEHFLGEPVTMVLPDPRNGTLHAALKLGHFGVKMRRSHDGGTSWHEYPAPAYPPEPESAPAAGAGDDDTPAPQAQAAPASRAAPSTLEQVWSLEAGGADEAGVLWAGTIPGGLFRSPDGGDSWELVRSLWDRPERAEWFGGGYDQPGIHSICVDPRASGRVTVGVSCGGVWQTSDGGQSWACHATGMRADYMPAERRGDPNIQDPHRLVQSPANPDVLWVQHHCGIYRSGDGAASWHECHATPSSFGFALAAHPQDADTAWFVPAVKDECRIPVNARLVVTRTRDGGKSFETLATGLPRGHAYDLVYRHGLTVNDRGDTLAMGSTTGSLWISEDGGDSWHCLSSHLPPIYCVRFAAA